MSKTGETTRASVCTTISPPATQQTRSINTEDKSALLTYLQRTLEKETKAGNERGMEVYTEARDAELAKLKAERLAKLEWEDRYDAFVNDEDAQSKQ